MTLQDMIKNTEMSLTDLSKELDIPYRTIQDWASGNRKPPEYAEKLLMEKLSTIKKTDRNPYTEKSMYLMGYIYKKLNMIRSGNNDPYCQDCFSNAEMYPFKYITMLLPKLMHKIDSDLNSKISELMDDLEDEDILILMNKPSPMTLRMNYMTGYQKAQLEKYV